MFLISLIKTWKNKTINCTQHYSDLKSGRGQKSRRAKRALHFLVAQPLNESCSRLCLYDSERIERLPLGTSNYNEFRMLPLNWSKHDWFSIDIQTFETCIEVVMAVKAYKHCQAAQELEISLVPQTEVSLFDSQYLKS